MQKAELMTTLPALNIAGDYLLERGADALDSFTTESLDLLSALIPHVAIWSHRASIDASLSERVRLITEESIDVYVAPVHEPVISSKPFCEKTTLICPKDIDDLSLRRTLFTLKSHEDMVQRVLHISALLFAGCIATFGSAPLLAACAYVPLHCIASAYTHDIPFLVAFPEEKEALVEKREQDLQPPAAHPKTLGDYSSNARFYLGVYLSATLKRDVVNNFEACTETEPEVQVEIEPEVQVEPEIAPSVEEVEEPIEPPIKPLQEERSDSVNSRRRGGHQGR